VAFCNMSLASSVLPSAASASAQLCIRRRTWQVVRKVKKKVKKKLEAGEEEVNRDEKEERREQR